MIHRIQVEGNDYDLQATVNLYHILNGGEQGGNGGPLLSCEGRAGGEGTGTYSEEGKIGVPSTK